MRTLRILFLALAAIVACSCSKSSEDDLQANYSVLGITTMTINGQEYSVKNGGVLDSSQNPQLALSSIENAKSKKHITLHYALISPKDVTPTIEVKSGYPDVSIAISKQAPLNSYTTYSVSIKRNGYQETLTYIVTFMVQPA